LIPHPEWQIRSRSDRSRRANYSQKVQKNNGGCLGCPSDTSDRLYAVGVAGCLSTSDESEACDQSFATTDHMDCGNGGLDGVDPKDTQETCKLQSSFIPDELLSGDR